MEIDNSFEALFNPGEANNFFDIAGLQAFEPGSNAAYSRTNGLWLAEFCRLIYRQGKDEINRPESFVSRDAILRRQGWREQEFINLGGTQAGIFVKDNRCAVIVFRGTLGLKDVISDANVLPIGWRFGGNVHGGFKAAFDAAWGEVGDRLLNMNLPFFLTGHSLGAALATLAASTCLHDPALANCPLAGLYTLGSPRVGDGEFGATTKGLFHCRIVNEKDIVATLPPKSHVKGFTFQHTGQMHRIGSDGRLKIFPPGQDDAEAFNPVGDALDVVESVAGLLQGIRALRLEPPVALRDHTPVNYTARLEKAT